MEKAQIIKYVEECLEKTKNKFRENPDYFIDSKEDDVLAYLYHLIALNEYFLKEMDYLTCTGEKIKTKPLLIKSTTLQKIKRNKGSFDLAVLNSDEKPEHLIAIELKWIGKLDSSNLKEIKDDIDKLAVTKNEIENGYVIVFNNDNRFTDDFKKKIMEHNKSDYIKIDFVTPNKLI